MFRLLEVTYSNNKETPALYDDFADETALTAEFDTKMGAAMKAEAYKAELLVAFDSTGRIYAQGYHSKDDSVSLSPRLVWVTVDSNGEISEQTKENDLNALEADKFSKRGSAKKKADVKAILLLGIDGKGVYSNDYWARPIEPVEPQEEVEEQGE